MPCFGGYGHPASSSPYGSSVTTHNSQEDGSKLDESIRNLFSCSSDQDSFCKGQNNNDDNELNKQLVGLSLLGSYDCLKDVEITFIMPGKFTNGDNHPIISTMYIDATMNDRALIRRMAMSKIKGKEMAIQQSNVKASADLGQLLQHCGVDVIVGIFEFLETKVLVESCLGVCKEWNQILLHDEVFASRVVYKRIWKVIEKTVSPSCTMESVVGNLGTLYRNMSWIEIYLMSGIFHLEMCENVFKQIVSQSSNKLFSILRLNPFAFLNVSPEHVLYKRLGHKFKSIMTTPSISNRFYSKYMRNISRRLNFEDAYCFEEIISTPVILPLPEDRMGFSVNFRRELVSYWNFLKEVTSELSHLVQDYSITVANSLDNMYTKALRFIERRNPLQDYSIGKDVLIGMHLLLLDGYYKGDNLYQSPSIAFGRLLQTRNSKNELPNKFYPKNYRSDLYQDLVGELGISKLTNKEKKKWKANNSPFKHPLNSIEFLKEHIFELSQTADMMLQDEQLFSTTIQSYVKFLKTKENSFPSKEVDLIFHYHLLNPQHYIQDSKRVAGFVKFHDLNFKKY